LAERGADLRVPAPGQARKRALLGVRDHGSGELVVHVSASKRSTDFIALLEILDLRYGPKPGRATAPVVLVLDHGPIHTSRLVANMVIDQETVTRTFPDGPGEVDVVALDEVENGRIAKAWWLLSGSGVVPDPSRNQACDERAEQGFAAPARVVHELEEAEVVRQLVLRDTAVRA